MTVRELLSKIDSRELSEWAAYHSTEPIGYFRSDLQAGIVASTMANCNRTQNTRAFTPKDFMPIGEHRKPTIMDEDDIKQAMMGMGKKG